ncbi:hypothetical protein ACWGJW_18665 [Streptomyces nigrescens]
MPLLAAAHPVGNGQESAVTLLIIMGDSPEQDYYARRIKEGKARREIIR